MKALFTVAVLLNAGLIFWVELLYGKRILPALGGSPAVWNTCLMFYQVVLLAGYGYVLLLDRLRPPRQYAVHAGLVALAVAWIPWSLFLWTGPTGTAPVLWLAGLLTLSLGFPFFVLAAGAPLLQRWFSHSGHEEGGDPYFLYAASNLGSFLALAAYPLVLEPLLTLDQQEVLWKGSFATVGLLVLVSGGMMLRGARGAPAGATPGPVEPTPAVEPTPVPPAAEPIPTAPVTAERRIMWIVFAFLPSSLLLGVTTHITSEIAPVPLLWVVPLALYLLTFVVAFGPGRHRVVRASGGKPSRRSAAFRGVLGSRWLWLLGGALLLLLLPFLPEIFRGVIRETGWLLIAGDLAILTAAGLLCHGRLARDRPRPDRLAEFYFWLALGGALGGVFNTLLAPVLFEDPLEYPLALALFAFVARWGAKGVGTRVRPSDLLLGAIPGAIALAIVWAAPRWGLEPGLLLPLAGIACLAVAGRPVPFGLGVAGLVFVGFALPRESGDIVFRERTFYGIHRVYWDEENVWLSHGTTIHGGQNALEPGVPLTYYHPDGPAGTLFGALYDRGDPGDARVAVVGLGTGSLIAYSRPGQRWTFYELDPTVVRLAENPTYFRFLSDAFAPYRIVLGDARLSLEEIEEEYDLIIVDAFSSDAIPVHLLTAEAVALYRSRLRPGGWIAFHTSNRFIDFSPVLANIAAEAGVLAYEATDSVVDEPAGRYPSRWVVLAEAVPGGVGVGRLLDDPRWQALAPSGGRSWTDAYSSLFQALR